MQRFVTPAEFDRYREWALARGFLECVSGPLVRSSYRAEQALARNNAGLDNSALAAANERERTSRLAAAAPLIEWLGRVEYEPTWRAMQAFTDAAMHADTAMKSGSSSIRRYSRSGMSGKREHLLAPGDIPVVQIDRGGQVTYHGPGQLVVYPLIDLRRADLGVRDFVTALERAVIEYAAHSACAADAGATHRAYMWQGASWRASVFACAAARAITALRST